MLLIDDTPECYHTLGRFEMQLITGYMFSDPSRVASILEGYADAADGDYTWFKRYLDWNVGDNIISLDGMAEAMDIASGISPERLARVEMEASLSIRMGVVKRKVHTCWGLVAMSGSTPRELMKSGYRQQTICGTGEMYQNTYITSSQ